MGRIPHFTAKIFPSANLYVLFAFADVGIVLFMNLVGLELDFSIMQTQWKRTFIVSAVGIALPMAVSVGSSYAVWNSIDKLYPAAAGVNKSFGTFVVFMYVAKICRLGCSDLVSHHSDLHCPLSLTLGLLL